MDVRDAVLTCRMALVLAAMTAASAQEQPDNNEMLVRVGERIAQFYKSETNVICIETSTVQAVDLSYSPEGFARTVESDLHVEAHGGQTLSEEVLVRTDHSLQDSRLQRP